MRVLLGITVAPIAPVLLIAGIILLVGGSIVDTGPFLVTGLYAYPAMLLVGIPLYRRARVRGTFTLQRTVTSAAITGGLIGAISALTFLRRGMVAPTIGLAGLFGTWGALQAAMSGLCFWYIVGRSSKLRWSGSA